MSTNDEMSSSGSGAPVVQVHKSGGQAKPGRLRQVVGYLFQVALSRLMATTLVILVIGAHLFELAPIPLLNRHFYDTRMQARPPRRPNPDIALVTVDDQAIQELGRWPWPRSVFADLVDALDKAGARVISLDVGFLEPDAYSARKFLGQVNEALGALKIENEALEDLLVDMGDDADTDARLARSIAAAKADVVLGYYLFDSIAELGYEITDEERTERLSRILPTAFNDDLGPGASGDMSLPVAHVPHPPVKQLADVTSHMGYLRATADVDASIRRSSLMVELDGMVYPSLALATARAFRGSPEMRVKLSEFGVEGVQLGPRLVPTDPSGSILVNYHGPPPIFPRFSAADVIAGRVGRDEIEDRLIIVGGTASGIRDDFRTPMGARQNGVEIRATVVDNIIQAETLVRMPWHELLGLVFLGALGALAVMVIPAVGNFAGLVGTVVGAVGVLAVDGWLFTGEGVWLPVVPGCAIVIVVYAETLLRRYLAERDRRQQVEGTFGRYVAPTVVQAMLSDPDKLQLGGEERRLTVLFSDLAGFTATTEKLSPSEMVALMCEYFEEMTAKIYDQEGMLKEYVGDEIMALFGAPVFHEDHAVRACRAAIAMHDRLQTLAQEWVEQGRPPLNARWGVNTGTMLVGNLGSSYRFSYGALGDAVNLGSRLEGLNSQYGSRILIGEETAEDVKDVFILREVDAVRVKGKSKVVRVHELLGEAGTPAVADWSGDIETYAAALARYREGKFERAKELFEKLLARRPEDGPSLTMHGRCLELIKAPPPTEEWDGVFTATKK